MIAVYNKILKQFIPFEKPHDVAVFMWGKDFRKYLILIEAPGLPLEIGVLEEELKSLIKKIGVKKNGVSSESVNLSTLEGGTDSNTHSGTRPPWDSCPHPRCKGKPRLEPGRKWWECDSGQPHFIWTTSISERRTEPNASTASQENQYTAEEQPTEDHTIPDPDFSV